MSIKCSQFTCKRYLVLHFNPLEKLILWLKRAKCYRCYYFNRELEMCSKLPSCSCGCDYYVSRNAKCINFKKSKW